MPTFHPLSGTRITMAARTRTDRLALKRPSPSRSISPAPIHLSTRVSQSRVLFLFCTLGCNCFTDAAAALCGKVPDACVRKCVFLLRGSLEGLGRGSVTPATHVWALQLLWSLQSLLAKTAQSERFRPFFNKKSEKVSAIFQKEITASSEQRGPLLANSGEGESTQLLSPTSGPVSKS